MGRDNTNRGGLGIDIGALAESTQTNPAPHFLNRKTGEIRLAEKNPGPAGEWLRIPAPPSNEVYTWMGKWLGKVETDNERDLVTLQQLQRRHGEGGSGVFRECKETLSKSPALRKLWLDFRQRQDRAWVERILRDNYVRFHDTTDEKKEMTDGREDSGV